jgi:hypothetical protein
METQNQKQIQYDPRNPGSYVLKRFAMSAPLKDGGKPRRFSRRN